MTLEICRICGTTKDLKNVFNEGNDELVEQIRLCTNIPIDSFDSLPKFVCKECIIGLEFSYRLRKRSEETEKKLRQDLLLISIEPYSMADESMASSEDKNFMVEELCDEEIWINDKDDLNLNESDMIEKVTNSNEDIFNDYLEGEPDDTSDEKWICLENEVSVETVKQENLENNAIESAVEDPLERNQIDDVKPELEVAPTIQTKTNKYQCEMCDEPFEKKLQYLAHVKIHANKRFKCGVCGKQFTLRFRFDEHMRNHLVVKKNINCPKCEKSYTHLSNLVRHVRSAHNRERKFKCAQCDACFGRSDILTLHMAKHTDKRTAECVICKKKFKTKQSLRLHMRIHEYREENTTDPKDPNAPLKPSAHIFGCEHCGKISRHKTTHTNHIRIHTGEKPYKCKFCDKSFRTTQTRGSHELLHTDERPHLCKICGVAFRQISHVRSHMLTHTGDKRHVCGICKKAFAVRCNLTVHMRTHTGEMPYECNQCPMKFLLSNQFKRHKLVHVNEDNPRAESLKNEDDIEGELHDPQVLFYVDEIIESTPDVRDIVVE